jgi:hypothetical protein
MRASSIQVLSVAVTRPRKIQKSRNDENAANTAGAKARDLMDDLTYGLKAVPFKVTI